jgi:hypothetical protein
MRGELNTGTDPFGGSVLERLAALALLPLAALVVGVTEARRRWPA